MIHIRRKVATMTDEVQTTEETTATPETPEEKKPFMDRQFANMSGCGFFILCLLFPVIALLFGIVGLIACKDPKARERATNMTIFGGIVLVVCIILIFAQAAGS